MLFKPLSLVFSYFRLQTNTVYKDEYEIITAIKELAHRKSGQNNFSHDIRILEFWDAEQNSQLSDFSMKGMLLLFFLILMWKYF